MKIARFAALVMAAATFLLSGCEMLDSIRIKNDDEGKNSQAAATKVLEALKSSDGKPVLRLAYWNKEETMAPFLELAKEKFPEIEIKFEQVPVENFLEVTEKELEEGNAPDILAIGEKEDYARKGYLIDLTNESFIKNYSRAALDSIAVDGRIYGLPGISWFEGIFYNRKIFREKGIAIPKTFDEMMEVHKRLRAAGIVPQAFGASSWEPLAKSPIGLAIVDFLQTEEGNTFDSSIRIGQEKFQGSGFEKSVEKWTQYIKNAYITKDMLNKDYDMALHEFASGEAAMWESGPWAVKAIKEANPDLKFDMMPFVGTEEGGAYLIGGHGVTFGANANSAYKKEAMEILKLMATKEGQQALCAGSPGSSSFFEGANIELPKEFNGVKEVLDLGNIYCPWFVWKGNDAYNKALGEGIKEVIKGNKTVAEVMEDMDRKVEEQTADKDK